MKKLVLAIISACVFTHTTIQCAENNRPTASSSLQTMSKKIVGYMPLILFCSTIPKAMANSQKNSLLSTTIGLGISALLFSKTASLTARMTDSALMPNQLSQELKPNLFKSEQILHEIGQGLLLTSTLYGGVCLLQAIDGYQKPLFPFNTTWKWENNMLTI